MPPNYNHPARVAEQVATLDLVSNGRVEFGTGESSSLAELGGFRIPVEEKRNQWLETVEQTCNMMAMEPYPGYEGKYFSMPCRNVVPKPTQRPHPPLWVACSNRETIKLAARLGIGALTFAFVDPDEAKHWVDDYYRILKEECVPIGHTINPNIAMVTSFGCHKDHDEAVRRMQEGFQFFSYGLGHHYVFGINKPGRTNIWEEFQKNKIKQLIIDLNKLLTFINTFNFQEDHGYNKLYLWAEENLDLECSEYIVSMMLEPYDSIVDPLIQEMSSEEEKFFNIPGERLSLIHI